MSDSSRDLIIGVDGGGSGCRAAIGTIASGIMATAEGGRANASSDPDLAIENIRSAVISAAKKASISPDLLNNAHAHLGLAGVMSQADGDRIANAMPFKKSVVTEDTPIAVAGALGGGDGYLLSIGTGTIMARAKDGVVTSVNGWGFHVSDQAAGAWLGRASLEQVLLCHDGIEAHSALTRALFEKFDADPNVIVAFSMRAKPGDYAKLAPDVVAGAQAGDPWGRKIMQSGSEHLQRGLSALEFVAGDVICLTGGVGPHYANYLPDGYLDGAIACQGSALDGAFALAKADLLKQLGEQV